MLQREVVYRGKRTSSDRHCNLRTRVSNTMTLHATTSTLNHPNTYNSKLVHLLKATTRGRKKKAKSFSHCYLTSSTYINSNWLPIYPLSTLPPCPTKEKFKKIFQEKQLNKIGMACTTILLYHVYT